MSTRQNRRSVSAELPALDPGVTLVDVDDELGVTPVQALLCDALLGSGRDAHWVDAAGAARTARLRELVPHPRYLDRIAIARGFTPHQHTSLIDRLAGRLTEPPAVVLATGVDRLYRSADLPAERAEALFVRALAALARVARVHEVPVVVTRSRADEFAAPLAAAARDRLRCRATPFGPRFERPDGTAETLVYRVENGWVQTTIAYWQTVLEHRVRMHDSEPAAAGPGVATEAR
jgi:hypothetical protein